MGNVKNESKVRLGGQVVGGLTATAGQVKRRSESVKTKNNQNQGSQESSSPECFHPFMYHSTYLIWFQTAFQEDGQTHQPA